MATINALGVALSGKIGPGTTFAGGVPATNLIGTWTPTIIFTSLGDLSVVYTTQVGTYHKVGGVVFISFTLSGTPTYTTAAGSFNIGGIPSANRTASGNTSLGSVTINSSYTWSVGITQYNLYITSAGGALGVIGTGTGKAFVGTTVAQIPSGTVVSMQGSISYFL